MNTEHTDNMHILNQQKKEGVRVIIAGIIIALAALFFIGMSSAYAQAYPTMPALPMDQSLMPSDGVFTALLTPEEEVPPTTSTSRGRAHFALSQQSELGSVMQYQLIVHGGENVTAAHLHCAGRGISGPPIVNLYAGETRPSVNGELASGIITMRDILAAGATCSPNIRTVAHLAQAIREGKVYANVHTTKYPNGEIRGQVMMHMPNIRRDIPINFPTTTMNGSMFQPISGGAHIIANGFEIQEIKGTRPGANSYVITISHDLLRQITNMLPNIWQMLQAHMPRM